VFEIGAGDGRLLALLPARGYAVRGVEPTAAYAALAGVSRLRGRDFDGREAEIDPGSRDAVFAWHVLEHVADPAVALARVRGWLVPRGRLIAAVSNLSSIEARAGSDRWFQLDMPRHRTNSQSRKRAAALADGLRRRAAAEGAARPESRISPHARDAPHPAHPVKERHVHLAKRNLGSRRGDGQVRDVLTTVVAAQLLPPVPRVVELVAGATGRGGSLVVEAVPREERSAA
jgi:SAM-dependent methyltransferase